MKTYENIMEVNRNLDYSCLKIFNHLNEAQLHITQAHLKISNRNKTLSIFPVLIITC